MIADLVYHTSGNLVSIKFSEMAQNIIFKFFYVLAISSSCYATETYDVLTVQHVHGGTIHAYIVVSSSARYGDTYRYRRYARVVIPLFNWDDFIELFHACGWP